MTGALPPRPGRLADLGIRIASAVVMVAAALAALQLGGLVFLLFWLVASAAVFWEWQHMIGGARVRLRCLVGISALAIAANFAAEGAPHWAIEVLVVGACGLFIIADRGTRRWSALGMFYAGALLVAMCVLRYSQPDFYQRLAIFWLFAIVWGCDVMAYFAGRLIGGPKLWSRVSPSKTWSGTLAGIMSGALLGLGAVVASGEKISIWPVLALGLVLASASQGGDLLESAMKRRFGVKDSSHLIPGHGGFMDRLDGFIVASVLAALIGTWHYDSGLAANGLFTW